MNISFNFQETVHFLTYSRMQKTERWAREMGLGWRNVGDEALVSYVVRDEIASDEKAFFLNMECLRYLCDHAPVRDADTRVLCGVCKSVLSQSLPKLRLLRDCDVYPIPQPHCVPNLLLKMCIVFLHEGLIRTTGRDVPCYQLHATLMLHGFLTFDTGNGDDENKLKALLHRHVYATRSSSRACT